MPRKDAPGTEKNALENARLAAGEGAILKATLTIPPNPIWRGGSPSKKKRGGGFTPKKGTLHGRENGPGQRRPIHEISMPVGSITCGHPNKHGGTDALDSQTLK